MKRDPCIQTVNGPNGPQPVILIDLRTDFPSGSAARRRTDDPSTRVSIGVIYASITMFDLHLEVLIDPFEGDWSNARWARAQALSALKRDLTPEILGKITALMLAAGRRAGREQLRSEFNALLFGRQS